MIDLARDIVGTQPILTAFLAIGLGYLVGQITIGSFSLGVGAVPQAHVGMLRCGIGGQAALGGDLRLAGACGDDAKRPCAKRSPFHE